MARLGRSRGGRRRDLPPPALADGTGYVVELHLEARLLGRLRLLAVDATVAVAEDTGTWADRAPSVTELVPPLGTSPRARLVEAAALLDDARTARPPGPAPVPSVGPATR